jgi:predicted  nucleic acid-binding Zn-ribbon protein
MNNMLSDASKKIRDKNVEIDQLKKDIEQISKEVLKLKTQIDFERNMHQAEVNQLNDDIKFLRSKLPNL